MNIICDKMTNFLQKYGWSSNPFTLVINPKHFTGYEDQIKALKDHIENRHKIAILLGPTGSGKTMTLRWLEDNLRENVLYISKPPKSAEQFIDIFIDLLPLTFWQKIFNKRPSLYTLPKYINTKLKGNQLIFLLDEAHETSKDVLEWLRVLVDQIDNVSLIMAGMPMLEQKLKTDLETLDQRVTTRIRLTNLNQAETFDLIMKRIASVGGEGIKPFTEAAIEKIYHKTGGFPRQILKECDKLISLGKDIIDASDIDEFREFSQPNVRLDQPIVSFSPKPPSEDQLNSLPYKQRKILEILSKRDWLSPSAIAQELDMSKYGSRGHAVRSVNNILRRLMLEGYVLREAKGKAFVYTLTPKIKTYFVEQ
ncbi:MAG: AAA family ATPase [Candidatus Aenigmarchaeota archaeon]|nr:AAA family ATPase [Candidatus Aenigmarchaeota archaeon]